MRIALVAPSAVPFAPGGAERLWWGLTNYINRHTAHAMELIKLPSPERNLWEIAASYRQFSLLALDHFDMVISTKYPAWMVAHGHHVVYLQHTLRGLYDTYPVDLPERPAELPDSVLALWHLLERPRLERSALPDLFGRLEALRTDERIGDETKARLVAFPGPFARAVVHALDRVGLAPGAVRRYLAISKTVAQREGYFPPGAAVDVVPHPPDLEAFREEPGEFVFTASRLDGAKRLDLLVEAYRRCRTNTPFLIAGEGPAGDALRALAADDPRIRFVGRLTDEELLSHYARAHFVAFVPYQEDMGLVTLEAMKSGKPVLTVNDAGGVTEFVRDGVNGRVVAPDVDSLARAIDTLMADRDRLLAMGVAARATGAEVTWTRTVDALFASSAAPFVAAGTPQPARKAWSPIPATAGVRTRILVLNTFGVHPPDSGGKKRVFYLCQALSRRADVTLLNLGAAGSRGEWREFSPHYREIRIPPDARFQAADVELHAMLNRSVTDIAALLYAHEIPALATTFMQLTASADVVMASHVYLAPLIARHWTGELWYDAHNVEADMKADILGEDPPRAPCADIGSAEHVVTDGTSAVAAVARAEGALVRSATRVLAASRENASRFAELYGRSLESIEHAPNGVSLPDDPWLDPARRGELKATLGFAGRPVALFVGSDHGPNHDAADLLIEAASVRTEWVFCVVGSICDYAAFAGAPSNVHRYGVVTEAELTALMRAADVGLNPMRRGSGTNLKMLDYAAHGALVLSTEVGARGLGFVAGTHYIAFPPDALGETLAALASEVPSPRVDMRTAARELVEREFSWRGIADRIALPNRER